MKSHAPALALRLSRARPGAAAAIGVAATSQWMPLFGGGELLLPVGGIRVPVQTNAGGTASHGSEIPDDPVLRGAVFFAQSHVLDPAGAFFGMAVATAGIRIRVGD